MIPNVSWNFRNCAGVKESSSLKWEFLSTEGSTIRKFEKLLAFFSKPYTVVQFVSNGDENCYVFGDVR